jgi:OOP family OmpA-OmpF porin
MKIPKMLLLTFAFAIGLAQANEAVVQSPPTQSASVPSAPSSRLSWQTFQTIPLADARLARSEGRIVFVRAGPQQETATPSDIFINGRFHTAVLPGAYAEVRVCAGEHRIEIKSRATAGIEEARAPQLKVLVKPLETAYVGLDDPRSAQALRVLSAQALPRDLGQLPRQNHAVSRLSAPANCEPQEKRYNLAAELLFKFGKSDAKDLLSSGEAQIVRLAGKINEEHASIETIQVLGHTDPMGSQELNQRLSQQRAQTVLNILVAAGLPANRITAKGMGDQQLVVTNCASKGLNRTDLLGCNQPNRRVEVLVRGVQEPTPAAQ